jgi:hypothetical protein
LAIWSLADGNITNQNKFLIRINFEDMVKIEQRERIPDFKASNCSGVTLIIFGPPEVVDKVWLPAESIFNVGALVPWLTPAALSLTILVMGCFNGATAIDVDAVAEVCEIFRVCGGVILIFPLPILTAWIDFVAGFEVGGSGKKVIPWEARNSVWSAAERKILTNVKITQW